MQENIQRMLNLIENCDEFQKAVYLDTISDLSRLEFEYKKNIDLDSVPA
jgi:hypothetical protein